jgi:hypothetical protein
VPHTGADDVVIPEKTGDFFAFAGDSTITSAFLSEAMN